MTWRRPSIWFRRRRIGQWFPIGAVMAFIFGVAVAPDLGARGLGGVLVYGVVLGAVGSVALFLFLKVIEWSARD